MSFSVLYALRENISTFLACLLSGETFFIFLSLIISAVTYYRSEKKIDTEEDAKYVRQVKNGDKEAYLFLFNKYSDDIYRYSYYFLSRRRAPAEDAQDAMCKAFMKCLENIYMLRNEGSFYFYLVRTAKSICMDVLRDKQAFDEPLPGVDPSHKVELSEDIANSIIKTVEKNTPAKEVLIREIQNDVRKALNMLQENYREAVILVHLMEYSYKEAAEIMGVKESDIKRWVNRGIVKLREALKGYRGSIS